MEELPSCLPERVLCTDFSKEVMAKSSTSQRSLHTLTQHLMALLIPFQEPCAVKVALEEEY
jgi:hypothetical protein